MIDVATVSESESRRVGAWNIESRPASLERLTLTGPRLSSTAAVYCQVPSDACLTPPVSSLVFTSKYVCM